MSCEGESVSARNQILEDSNAFWGISLAFMLNGVAQMTQAEARASLVQEVIAKLNPPKKKETVTVVDLQPEKPQSPGKLY